ncbi:TraB/GumN family protein [Pelomonas sp. CA6]|uniref:TraB/GumN family protein n=1 Tax=Pelomonas sp. CA6 TaxID=2907999 RepID=UPI001F4B22F0|nr:TraB/GumN family protein [Pelomonas sp. CA6]MCH7342502.1 TraB/GumN family protein [Pelomonas sp. CA6]
MTRALRPWHRLARLLLLLAPLRAAALEPPAPPACPAAPAPLAAAQLAEQASDRGMLWRLRRDGRDSYLYATLHLGQPGWAYPGPRLQQALAGVRRIALELDPLDPAALQMPPTPPLPLDAPLRQRLAAQARAQCLDAAALERQHPLLGLSLLSLLDARRDGMDVLYGQDLMLAVWARQHGLPVLALESAALQLQALIPADAGLARAELAEGLEALERGRNRPQMRTLAALWAAGDLAALQDTGRWCDCDPEGPTRQMLARLNDERNPALARRIAALHAEGPPLLAAVGALHMTGPQALPRLLRELGFEVSAVHPR